MKDKDENGRKITDMKLKKDYPTFADVPIRRQFSVHWLHIIEFILECVDEHVKSKVYKKTNSIQPPKTPLPKKPASENLGGVEPLPDDEPLPDPDDDESGPCDFPLFYDLWQIGAREWVK